MRKGMVLKFDGPWQGVNRNIKEVPSDVLMSVLGRLVLGEKPSWKLFKGRMSEVSMLVGGRVVFVFLKYTYI